MAVKYNFIGGLLIGIMAVVIKEEALPLPGGEE
jgi:hypothetical protein